MLPRDAFFAAKETITADQAAGRICAEQITPYPPGIPVIIPGERITTEILLDYLRSGRPPGCSFPIWPTPASAPSASSPRPHPVSSTSGAAVRLNTPARAWPNPKSARRFVTGEGERQRRLVTGLLMVADFPHLDSRRGRMVSPRSVRNNPLAVEPWWGDRPLRLWIARRLYDYSHRSMRRHRRAAVGAGRLRTVRGPDNEPPSAADRPVAWIAGSVISQAGPAVEEQNGRWGPLRRPAAG